MTSELANPVLEEQWEAAKRQAEIMRTSGPKNKRTLLRDTANLIEHVAIESVEQTGVDPVGCRPGCTACCEYSVSISRVEADVAVAAIKRLSKPLQRDIKRRLKAQAEYERDTGPDPRDYRRPCALLENGKCAIYADRPLACRAMFATDSALCATDGVEAYRVPKDDAMWASLLYTQPMAMGFQEAVSDADAMALLVAGRSHELQLANQMLASMGQKLKPKSVA